MTERGIVVRIEGEQVGIRCLPEACSSCGSCSRREREHLVRAVNRTGRDLQQGDQVEMYIHPGRAVLSGFLVLILPLLLFFPGYYLPELFGVRAEAVRVVLGLAGVAVGFLFNIVRTRTRKTQELPEIIRLVHRDAPQALHPEA
jgi:positive regulator of sigma E activity